MADNRSSGEEEKNLPRAKTQIKNHEYCDCCMGKDGIILYCDGCNCSFHLQCAYPPLQSDKIPEKEWYCTACSYREGLIKLDIPQTDPLYDFHKHLTTTNPLQYDVPEYISRYTEFTPPKKTTKYTRDLCEYCEQKGVHVKCAHVGCSRAFHLQCHDPPLFTIPQVFYCDLHVPKKDKEVKFLRPTSFVYVHDNDVDSKLLSPLIPIVKLQENLNK